MDAFVRSAYNAQQLARWGQTAYAPLSSLWSFALVVYFAALTVIRIVRFPPGFPLQLVMLGVIYLAIGECVVALKTSAVLRPGPFPVSPSHAVWGAIGFLKFVAVDRFFAVHGLRSGIVPATLCFFLGNIFGHAIQYAGFRVRSPGIPDIPTLGLTIVRCFQNVVAIGIILALARYG
jgi:hypothetical protein